jgi:hypothetical protein
MITFMFAATSFWKVAGMWSKISFKVFTERSLLVLSLHLQDVGSAGVDSKKAASQILAPRGASLAEPTVLDSW